MLDGVCAMVIITSCWRGAAELRSCVSRAYVLAPQTVSLALLVVSFGLVVLVFSLALEKASVFSLFYLNQY